MHKIGQFKYIGIKHLKINNTISQMSAKKDLNTLKQNKKRRNDKTTTKDTPLNRKN